tara:strand:+ start:8650 stop:9078 length:429 start_codon:yes stop_codon:yes gene_type:complete
MRTISVNDVISYGDKIIGRVTNVSNDTELYGAPYATIFCIHHENRKYIGSEIDYIQELLLRRWIQCDPFNASSEESKTASWDKFNSLAKLTYDALDSEDAAMVENTLLKLLEAIDKPSASTEYQLAAQDAFEAVDGHLNYIS